MESKNKPKKILAEDCFRIKLSDFGKKLLYPIGVEKMDSYDFLYNKENKALRGKQGYFVIKNGADALHVFYSVDQNRMPKVLQIRFQKQENGYSGIEQNIELEEDIVRFGIRTFFTCACGKFCTVLYKPPGENAFKCVKCANITYESQRINKHTLHGALYYTQRLIKLAKKREGIKRMFYGGGLSRKGRRFTELYDKWSNDVSKETKIKTENYLLSVANGQKDINGGLKHFL